MQTLKILFYKAYFTVALVYDENLSLIERLSYFFKTFLALSPIVFLMEHINLWFNTNQGFVIGMVALIFVNMFFCGMVHNRRQEFSWKTLLKKTNEMMFIVIISYLTLEIIMSVAGGNEIVTFFRITIQITTLLYPGSKILKNIFIFSKGEYPPEWLMKKVYNFQESGDLNEFLKSKNNNDGNIN